MIYFQCVLLNGQLILYETTEMIKNKTFQFDCLYYRVSHEKLAYQELSNIISDTIPYCFRPLNIEEKLLTKLINTRDQNLTFEELRRSNITAKELLFWSSPIDLVERYQVYLNELNPLLSKELFYNCTKPWFGLRCEYSFQSSEEMSIIDVVEKEFSRKISSSNVSQGRKDSFSCYIHLPCNRGEPFLCLDWREICDGHVDCLDEGLDEIFCFNLELNQCEENEYRCHNGLCIPEEFWEDGLGIADCLDRSDEFGDVTYPNFCYQDPTFRCEEHTCRTNWHSFSCGDGQCVQKFDRCHNGRHYALIQLISLQGNLDEKCWIVMMCLTKLMKEFNGNLCQINSSWIEYLRYCPSIFQFPLLPVDFGHIRFLYRNISLRSNLSLLIIPDYICYNDELCDCFIPNYFYENLTCLDSKKLDLSSSVSGHIWIDMILSLNSYFRSCSMNYSYSKNHFNLSSLYQCPNSSKLISPHRIADQNIDCCDGNDEDSQISCSINDKHRVKCSDKKSCLSSLHTIDDCLAYENEAYERKLSFRSICDGLGEIYFKDVNGRIHTDESECHFWPCNNMYSRCDGFWTCSNGDDEENCSKNSCEKGHHPCISLFNNSLICLSGRHVGDGINDCLGATDEMHFCRRVYSSEHDPKRFRCRNSDICLAFNELCNNIRSCPHGDDEDFCPNHHHRLICQSNSMMNQTTIEDVICRWNENEKNRIVYFSIHTSSNYPQVEKNIENQTIDWQLEQNPIVKYIDSGESSYPWPWYCNRGLRVRIRRTDDDEIEIGCMCPPSYYGERCQYQSQRISLTIGLIRAERRDVYVIILMLIDQASQWIDSYDQFEYVASQSCGMKLNRYLLYPNRPKNISTNSSIRIDVYEKNSMTYRGSWHLAIPFLFLPVNRISALLFMPYQQSSLSSSCSIKCENGECIQYRNNAQSFCRCYSGWSGLKCDLSIDCQSCSSDSICLGSNNNQSICICPLMKFGPRCLLLSSCPKHACQNHGQCIPADMTLSNKDYSCICSDQYYGSRCQYLKAKLEIYLENLNIPSYLLAYFFTISNQSDPTITIMLQKLTLFQRMVTFRISIPYHVVLIKSDQKFYLSVIQSYPNNDLSTIINPSRECLAIANLFNSTIMKMSRFERVKYFHIPCQMLDYLNCFLDEFYLCLCTKDRHANCVEFNSKTNLQCSSKYSCSNDAQCLQDHPSCPSAIICVCTDCFFGNQCQFYAKGLGLTLEEILGYEIKRYVRLSKQTFSVQLSAILTMIMLLAGIINGILSILTFKNKTSREVGCGIYLLVSSIFSLTIVILFTLKFWFLFYSYRDFSSQKLILFSNCMIIEPLLKLLLYIDNWLNACVAGERAFAVFKGISFDKKSSRQMAKWIIVCVIIINILLLTPQFLYLHLFEDTKEERTWCVVLYSSLLHNYSSFIQFFHFFTPFLINLFSAIFIIIGTTRQRVALEDEHRFTSHFKSKLKQHKHLLISPLILVILSLPRLIISFTLDCQKSSKHFWFYLLGYFISFMPSVLIFLVFVLPSPTYKKEFKQVLSRIQRNFLLFNKHS